MQAKTLAALNRTGRSVIIIRNGAVDHGIQQRLTGGEANAHTVKGTWKSKTYPFPRNPDESAHFADEERGPHRERFFTFASIAIDFVPTIDDRVVDGETTYAVIKADPIYYGEETIKFTLVLRPV